MGAAVQSVPVQNQGTIFGHPKGLAVLFLTEMWERFSFYGMRALLILYMTQYLIVDAEAGRAIFGYSYIQSFVEGVASASGVTFENADQKIKFISMQIYGLYTGFVYFTPFFGGMLADFVFGQRKTVYIGGVLFAIGHFLMASESMFLVALLFLILGNGCFKPNISTQVGLLYPEGDPRRDGAFTIFYMGINLGAFMAPFICGTLGQKVGWHWGFGAAGVGMIIGLIVYHFGRHLLPPDRLTDRKAKGAAQEAPLTKEEWGRIFALIFLCAINIVFWAVFEQQGSTLQLWADERTNWTFFGFEVPSSWYQVFNPLFIFLFAPVMIALWNSRAAKGKDWSSVTKMGVGCLLAGLAFIVMIVASKMVGEDEKGSLMWLVGTTWLFTMGELYLSPIGLSLVTKVSPPRLVSMMMGFWFMSSFVGNYAAGYIGGFYELMSKDAFFMLLVVLGVASGLIFFAANKPLKKNLHVEA